MIDVSLSRNMIENLLNTLFPERCIFCKRYGRIACKSCIEKISKTYLFKKVNNSVYNYVFCGSFYKGLIRTQMHSFKFHEQAYLYKYFIMLCLREKWIIDFLKHFDYITYVPMFYKKERNRGYNQSRLLAKELGNYINVGVVDVLEKVVENKVQSSLDREQRTQNVKNVFKIKKEICLRHKNIILVDDILTTGSTMKECCQILKENGVNKICIFAISKA